MRFQFDPRSDATAWREASDAQNRSDPLADRFGRSKRKLRLSLTDRCNFRCGYCMPEEPEWVPRSQLLSYEELHNLAGLFVRRMGVDAIRSPAASPWCGAAWWISSAASDRCGSTASGGCP